MTTNADAARSIFPRPLEAVFHNNQDNIDAAAVSREFVCEIT